MVSKPFSALPVCFHFWLQSLSFFIHQLWNFVWVSRLRVWEPTYERQALCGCVGTSLYILRRGLIDLVYSQSPCRRGWWAIREQASFHYTLNCVSPISHQNPPEQRPAKLQWGGAVRVRIVRVYFWTASEPSLLQLLLVVLMFCPCEKNSANSWICFHTHLLAFTVFTIFHCKYRSHGWSSYITYLFKMPILSQYTILPIDVTVAGLMRNHNNLTWSIVPMYQSLESKRLYRGSTTNWLLNIYFSPTPFVLFYFQNSPPLFDQL